MIQFEKIENGKLYLSEDAGKCNKCQRAMIRTWSGIHDVAGRMDVVIMLESREQIGVCVECVKQFGVEKSCAICKRGLRYPDAFAIECWSYPKYPEDDTDRNYVCANCKKTRQDEVIEMLLSCDDVREL